MVTVVVELSLVVDSHDILSSLRFLLCWGEVYCESMVGSLSWGKNVTNLNMYLLR